jgi:hypothetical protein
MRGDGGTDRQTDRYEEAENLFAILRTPLKKQKYVDFIFIFFNWETIS